jgi:hypothetical protein
LARVLRPRSVTSSVSFVSVVVTATTCGRSSSPIVKRYAKRYRFRVFASCCGVTLMLITAQYVWKLSAGAWSGATLSHFPAYASRVVVRCPGRQDADELQPGLRAAETYLHAGAGSVSIYVQQGWQDAGRGRRGVWLNVRYDLGADTANER